MSNSTKPAYLVLEDGTSFQGISCGAEGEVFGEICFNTSLVGYLEVLSDPSYAGQIITMTYPQIGNYGVTRADLQRDRLALRGLVVRDICHTPSNFRSELSLPDFLVEQNVVAISQIDTRALTCHIRDNGAMRAVISTVDNSLDSLLEKVRNSPAIVAQNLAKTVSTAAAYSYQDNSQAYDFLLKPAADSKYKVVAYDCGAKLGILRNLHRAGCQVEVVPWDTTAADVLALQPDGVFFSNGPGDPEPVQATYQAAAELLGQVPVFGICLGHQMISLAAGSKIEKLKFGHRGANQPVMNLRTRKVEITAQNHGFGIVFASLGELVASQSGGINQHPAQPPSQNPAQDPAQHSAQSSATAEAAEDLRYWVQEGLMPVVQSKQHGRIQLTHVNLNDGTPEGIAFLDIPAFCVQYHPEASPGPTDSHYLFTAFTRLMDGREDYLDIDISADRLKEWK